MTDFEDIANRSFDEPLDDEQRAALRVWADALESDGDPRGGLIALELAMREQPHRRRELMRASNEHIVADGGGVLGTIAPLLQFKRALELDWRGGRLYGAFLDTRHVAEKVQLSPQRLVTMLLAAPATESLRRLHVRARQTRQVAEVMRTISEIKRPRPLEEVVVMTGVRPTSHAAHRGTPWASQMLGAYPRLRLLIVDGNIVQLPIGVQKSVEQKLELLAAAGTPDEPSARVTLGRALTDASAPLRTAAVERIEALGPAAFMYVDTLLALLEPRIVTPQAQLARCLRTIGPHARRALPQLAKITGRAAHYDQETRAVAGNAIAALRPISAAAT